MTLARRASSKGWSNRSWGAEFGLAAIAGARMFLPPALVARRRIRRGGVRRIFGLVALVEMLGDKIPGVPARTSPLLLLGRAASGAGIAIAAGPCRPPHRAAGRLAARAVLGATAALAGAFATARLRLYLTRVCGGRANGNALAGAIEDLALGTLGAMLAHRI